MSSPPNISVVTLLARSDSRGSDLELAYASPKVIKVMGADFESIQCDLRKRTRSGALSDESGSLSEHDGRR
ncbi:hypothetical protein N7488_004501 [Penicillium malachiteum]|nr:hypothetical protein N7488_004501 [Penicillium malachiteum]